MNEALLQDALRLRRAGKLAQAAELYGQVLRSEPKHFEALHALGILHYQGGRLEEAERLIREASSVIRMPPMRPTITPVSYSG
jgi:tetratricopeptide (TPR) repeat protein